MSVKVMSLIWDRSRHQGSGLLIMLAIADNASDDGANAWPSVTTLAKKTRLNIRSVPRLLKELEASGELTINRNAGPNRANSYIINIDTLTYCHPDLKDTDPVIEGVGTLTNDVGYPDTPRESNRPEPSIKSPIETSEGKQPPLDEYLFPVWFKIASSIPQWRTAFNDAEAWRLEENIIEDLAERKAYALRDWWPRQPASRTNKGNPYATWQNWCREDRDKQQDQGARNGIARNHPAENNGEGAIGRAAREQAERMARSDGS